MQRFADARCGLPKVRASMAVESSSLMFSSRCASIGLGVPPVPSGPIRHCSGHCRACTAMRCINSSSVDCTAGAGNEKYSVTLWQWHCGLSYSSTSISEILGAALCLRVIIQLDKSFLGSQPFGGPPIPKGCRVILIPQKYECDFGCGVLQNLWIAAIWIPIPGCEECRVQQQQYGCDFGRAVPQNPGGQSDGISRL